MYACASHVVDEDDGGASGPDGAGGAGGEATSLSAVWNSPRV